jgi:ADP-ribose pyrophosphatase
MRQLFFYGTLRDHSLLANVLGRDQADIKLTPAILLDFEVCAVKGEEFPFARQKTGSKAQGLLVSGLNETDIERLCYYEGAHWYGLQPFTVDVEDRMEMAEVFVSVHDGWEPDGLWDFDVWAEKDQGLAAEAALEVMFYFGQRTAQDVYAHFANIRVRANARLAARKSAPVILRRGFTQQDVVTENIRRPYLKFFSLEERDVRFRRFDGGLSTPVERAVFVAADAVTVLPYDPKTDLVMLVEQFRAGPHARGDQNPWCLEPIAGRMDVGETHAQTAYREALEEAELAINALEPVASYYTSPGAFTEYMVSFIGITDLAIDIAGIHGVAIEHEDIRSIVIPFKDLMAAVQSGEADNGPLLISAFWLQANRDRLRADYADT